MNGIEIDVTICNEKHLYLVISGLGAGIFYMRHGLADGKIEWSPEIDRELARMQERIEQAVTQTRRFSVKKPMEKDKTPTPEYWIWYRQWDTWWKDLTEERQLEIFNEFRESTS